MDTKRPGRGGRREGAGRKTTAHPEGACRIIGASVPVPLVDELDREGAARGLNRSQAVTQAIRVMLRLWGRKR